MLRTARLRIVPATPAIARADLAGPDALAQVLGLPVHPQWRPELFDAPAIEYSLRQLEADPAEAGWAFHYIVREGTSATGPLVIGIVGYKGKPGPDGSVEIGYSVVPEYQRQGIATEAAGALVLNAFQHPAVTRVLGETLPSLAPSIAVLERNGFHLIGEGSEPGVIRFEITRADFQAGRTGTPPHLRTLLRLLAHVAWADRRVGQALEAAGSPEPTTLELYAHVLGAESVWLARLRGAAPTVAVWPALSLQECHALAEELQLGYREFLWPLPQVELQRLVTYRNSAGEQFQTTVEDIVLHVCLHGSYHRGQIASRLRAAGTAPVPTDFIALVRGAAAATRRP